MRASQVSLSQIILYVQDVERLAAFYRDAFGLEVSESIEGEWAVLPVGPCKLALHRVGVGFRVADTASWRAESNAKLVLTVDRPVAEVRAELVAKGVSMGEVKAYPGTGALCDGRDPEGNVFQVAEVLVDD